MSNTQTNPTLPVLAITLFILFLLISALTVKYVANMYNTLPSITEHNTPAKSNIAAPTKSMYNIPKHVIEEYQNHFLTFCGKEGCYDQGVLEKETYEEDYLVGIYGKSVKESYRNNYDPSNTYLQGTRTSYTPPRRGYTGSFTLVPLIGEKLIVEEATEEVIEECEEYDPADPSHQPEVLPPVQSQGVGAIFVPEPNGTTLIAVGFVALMILRRRV